MVGTMRHLIFAAALMTGLIWSQPGQEITGNELYYYCKETSNLTNRSICLGYVMAVADFLSSSWCIPSGSSHGQAMDIVAKALKEHPEKRNENATLLAWDALRLAWPCPKKKP